MKRNANIIKTILLTGTLALAIDAAWAGKAAGLPHYTGAATPAVTGESGHATTGPDNAHNRIATLHASIASLQSAVAHQQTMLRSMQAQLEAIQKMSIPK